MDQPTKSYDTNQGNDPNDTNVSPEYGNSEEKPHAVPNKPNTMDFLMLQNLAKSESEEIISQISDNKEASLNLVRSPIETEQMDQPTKSDDTNQGIDPNDTNVSPKYGNSEEKPHAFPNKPNTMDFLTLQNLAKSESEEIICQISDNKEASMHLVRSPIETERMDQPTKSDDTNQGNDPNDTNVSPKYGNSEEKPHAVPNKPNTMDFLMLQNLAKSESEEIISQISDNKEAFMHLLRSPIEKLDVFALVMELLAKVCQSSFDQKKLTILFNVCNSPFILSLRNYMADLPDSDLKSANYVYWENPDDFWANFVTFCECIITLSPSIALAKCRPLIDATARLCLVELAERHKYKLPENCELILKKSREALAKHEKEKTKIEDRRHIRHVEDEDLEPPENFRHLSVMPTVFDFDEERTPYLRANIVKGGYRDVEHYLDVQFRLFREDCFGPLRDGIHQFMQDSTKSKYDNVRVYRNVKFVRPYSSSLRVGVVVELDEATRRSFKNVDWANNKRFIYGALVMFTRGNSKYFFETAKIIDRDERLLKKGQIPILMCERRAYNFTSNETYTMIESEIYFDPYYHVLTAMQEPSFPEEIAMKKYIIDVDPEPEPPAYLNRNSSYVVKTDYYTRKQFKVLDFDTWPSREELNLNESQYEAYRMALTHEFAVIQGPPGTGKTYLGVKVAETLIENVSGRLLIVCYTNHALDQFLEAILSLTGSIVRIGGQSHNEALEDINLNTLRQKEREEARKERRKPTLTQQVFFERRQTLREYIDSLNDVNKLIESIPTCVISYNNLLRYKPDIVDLRKFYGRSNGTFEDPLFDWLLEHVVYDLNEPVTLENEEIGNPDNANESDARVEVKLDDFEKDLSYGVYIGDIWWRLIKMDQSTLIYLSELYENANNEQKQYDVYREIIIRRSLIRTFEEMKSHYHQGVTVSNQANMQDPTSISPVDRWMLYFNWTENVIDCLRARLSRLQDLIREANDEYEESRIRVNCEFLKNFKVIGMTTSGAASRRKLIETLAPKIVIVEEAAEVLEQHVITALTKSCQHLILIGDHQQLRPSASNIKLARHYNIEVSLFERMIMNGIQSRCLSVQHRMRPQIAALISPAIYSDLQNHPSVNEFPEVRGVTCSVFFFTHNYKEEVVYDGASKTNEREGDMVLGLANYLMQQDYRPEDVTVLAAYSGQMFYMKKQRFKYPHLSDVRITVLDNYQGEESKIILLSLVRNNDENKIGFLSTDNRVCVALSRAKHGFYMFGNIKILKNKSPLWSKVADTLESFGSLGTSIRLMCPNHNEKISVISNPQDFSKKVPEGGCLQKCEHNLPCTHVCPLQCHGYDQNHNNIECTLKCERILCELNHVCPLMCKVECKPCQVLVTKSLTCGHDMLVPCHVAPDSPDVQCMALVKAKLPSCGHEVKKSCYMAPEKVECPIPCMKVIEKCGHLCTRKCHVEDDPNHEQYLCKKPCNKAKSGCSMELEGDRGAHQCVKMCHEECDDCDVEVVKKRNACKHKQTVACSKSPDEKPCIRNCARVLTCGHFCKMKCFEPCGNCQQLVNKQIPECGHEISVECGAEVERESCEKPCERTMSCGHPCRARCGDPCESAACGELTQCATPCGHQVQLPCNEYVASGAAVNPEVLVQRCEAPCGMKLACGHACTGTCARCRQGRLHAPCVKPCQQLRLCGHRCEAPCNQVCPPCEQAREQPCEQSCEQPCEKACEHPCEQACEKACEHPCEQPCEHPCEQPCEKACEHPCEQACEKACEAKCSRHCGAPCGPCQETCPHGTASREPCAQPCRLTLGCGHACHGVCGERCPDVCKPCHPGQFPTDSLGEQYHDDALFIVLADCGRVMEFDSIEKLMKEDNGPEAIRCCPSCRTPIINTPRYKHPVSGVMAKYEIDPIKERVYGNEERIAARRRELQQIVENFCDIHSSIYTDELYSHWKEAFDQIIPVVNSERKYSLLQLEMYFIYLNILGLLSDVHKKYTTEHLTEFQDSLIDQNKMICEELVKTIHNISQQQQYDIVNEIKRMHAIVHLAILINHPSYIENKSVSEVKDTVGAAKIVIFKSGLYNHHKAIEALKAIQNTINVSDVVSTMERLNIKAIGAKAGQWFKCPKGHFYSVEEFGGAVEVSRCVECIAEINEGNHVPSSIQNTINVSEVVSTMERLNIKAIGAKAGQWFKCPKGHFYSVEECGGAMEVSKCVECIAEFKEGNHLPS